MNTIISKYEYEEILKAHLKKNYYTVTIIMFFVSLLQFGIFFAISSLDHMSDISETYVLLITGGIFLGITIVLWIIARRVDQKDPVHYSFALYDAYETEGMKVPLYRMVQRGKNSELVYVLMTLNAMDIKLYDIRRKKLNIFYEGLKDHTTFKFHFKIKNDEEVIKQRVDVITNHRKVRLYGFTPVNAKLIVFLQGEGYHIEKIVKGKKSY